MFNTTETVQQDRDTAAPQGVCIVNQSMLLRPLSRSMLGAKGVTKCPCCTIQLAIVCSLYGSQAQTHILVAFGDPGLSRSHHDELLGVKDCCLRPCCSCWAAERAYTLHSGTRHCKHIQAPTWGECFPGFLTLVITKAKCVRWIGSLNPCKGCIMSEYQNSCRACWLLEFMSDDWGK